MSLLNLTSETMVTLSDRWLDASKQQKALTALPLVAPLLGLLQEAHEGLLSKQRTGSTLTRDIARNREQAEKRDRRHDRKIRGTHSVLTGFAELSDDEELTGRLLDLRDRLLPVGPVAITRSYVDQAGDAQRLPSRLDAGSKKLLSKLPAAEGPLEAHVNAWLEEARELGRLEEERDQLVKQLQAGDDGPTAAEVLRARHMWIRAARALEANLLLDPGADEETIEQVLGPLRRAEAKADRRRGGARNSGAAGEGNPREEQPAKATAGSLRDPEETLDSEEGLEAAAKPGGAAPSVSHNPS